MDTAKLVELAWKAGEAAYSPYSGFRVGACLLGGSGKVYTGCNIENVSYGAANCAERTAFYTAIAAGEEKFTAIAVVGERADGASPKEDFTPPCGICRQVMLEFCDPETFQVILGNRQGESKTFLLKELIPHSFDTF